MNRLFRLAKWLVVLALAAAVILAGAFVLLRSFPATPRAAPAWSLMPPLPSPRGEVATAVAYASPCPAPPCHEAERLFVLGGLSGVSTVEERVDVFEPAARRWRAAPALPAPRHHLAAAGLGQALYASGGATGLLRFPWTPVDSFWRLEAGADRWRSLEPMPEPRWGHRMVASGGRLFVVGGFGPSARVMIYEPDKGWTFGAPMPVQRDHLSVVLLNGRLWAIGGRSPRSLARVDVYDPAAGRWQPGPDLPAPTSGAADGALGATILIFGGEAPEFFGRVYDQHWMLDTAAASPRWQTAPAPPLAVHGADGAVFQGALVIAGGATRHGMLSPTAWTDAVQRLERAR